MPPQTIDESNLDRVRDSIRHLVERRLYQPFSPQEHAEYDRLLRIELELLRHTN